MENGRNGGPGNHVLYRVVVVYRSRIVAVQESHLVELTVTGQTNDLDPAANRNAPVYSFILCMRISFEWV